jgi:hypothetical protein
MWPAFCTASIVDRPAYFAAGGVVWPACLTAGCVVRPAHFSVGGLCGLPFVLQVVYSLPVLLRVVLYGLPLLMKVVLCGLSAVL